MPWFLEAIVQRTAKSFMNNRSQAVRLPKERSHEKVLGRLKEISVDAVCISVITKSELLFGVEVSPRRQQDRAALDEYLRHVEVLDVPDEAALHMHRSALRSRCVERRSARIIYLSRRTLAPSS